ncbi:MAG: hypothetical protein M1817_003193 [Caeruleum heppii]|nr:MAG: hypothetical protein M1817_003193 [Caeruleum heppii]
MADTTPLTAAIKQRRTYYNLSNSSPIPDSRIAEIIQHTLLHAPSSFNAQSTRIVLLLKKDHEKLWDFTRDILKTIVPAEKFGPTEGKIRGFHGGYGSVLFFEDPEPTKQLQSTFPTYADKFPQWSDHTSAIHQYIIWTALEAEGLGANLQHYNPLIDEKVKSEWKIPQEWSLVAQMVFGKPEGPPGDKTFKPIEERFFMHGGS